MGNALISRRGGGYAKIEFDNYTPSNASFDRLDITATLCEGRQGLAATTVGDYALFGGGNLAGDISDSVDAYNSNLVRSTPTKLDGGRGYLAATTVGDYALFGGGAGYDSHYSTNKVDVYNSKLVKGSNLSLVTSSMYLAATTVGNYALFAGGLYDDYDRNDVTAFNSNLTKSTPTDLAHVRYNLVATTVGNYALFAGGFSRSSSYSGAVDAYSSNLTKSTPTNLAIPREGLAATTVGNYALFGGGENWGNYIPYIGIHETVDAYNSNLTRSNPTSLSVDREGLAATTVGDYALFGGGYGGGTSEVSHKEQPKVDAYDSNLTRSNPTSLSVGKKGLAATAVGNYALFAGGNYYSYSDYETKFAVNVDVYGTAGKISIYPGSKYKFQYMGSEVTATSYYDEMNVPVPITGYIKVKNVTYS